MEMEIEIRPKINYLGNNMIHYIVFYKIFCIVFFLTDFEFSNELFAQINFRNYTVIVRTMSRKYLRNQFPVHRAYNPRNEDWRQTSFLQINQTSINYESLTDRCSQLDTSQKTHN